VKLLYHSSSLDLYVVGDGEYEVALSNPCSRMLHHMADKPVGSVERRIADALLVPGNPLPITMVDLHYGAMLYKGRCCYAAVIEYDTQSYDDEWLAKAFRYLFDHIDFTQGYGK